MAMSPFFGRRGNMWEFPDPMEVMVTLFDDSPASSFAKDAHAVASTNVDWKETPTEHVFKADLPGLKKEEVKVEIRDGRTLSISGQRKKEEVQQTDTWHRVERTSGKFMRKFRLPENANVDNVTAKVDNGVLTVVVPKVEKKAPQTRSIAIGGGDEHHGAAGGDASQPTITHETATAPSTEAGTHPDQAAVHNGTSAA